MTSDKLWKFLESYDSIISKSTSVEKCNDLLERIRIYDIFNIGYLNPSKHLSILQCKSKEEKEDFKLAQDVAMTIEILNNFKESRTFLIVPRSIYEFSEAVNQRFACLLYTSDAADEE